MVNEGNYHGDVSDFFVGIEVTDVGYFGNVWPSIWSQWVNHGGSPVGYPMAPPALPCTNKRS